MAQQKFELILDDDLVRAARRRAENEDKTLDQVLVDLLADYARGRRSGLSTYTVKRGDSLARIAREVYGNPHRYPLIQRANNLSDPGRIWVGQVLVIPDLPPGEGDEDTQEEQPAAPPVEPPAPPSPPTPAPPPLPPVEPDPTPPTTPTPAPIEPPSPVPQPAPPPRVDPCTAIPGEKYALLPIVGAPTDRPADKHADINLALRGYSPTQATLGLIDMNGATDPRAPQLSGLFADKRRPEIAGVYQVHQWQWSPPPNPGTRGDPITDFEVSLAGFAVAPGETIHVPDADYDIGQGNQVLVLYASPERITLKYTGEDSVVSGYAIHIEGICTEPSLQALYNTANAQGRRQLPALRAGQAVGRAIDDEVKVSIRDTGKFMDPRVRKDWWAR